MRGVNPPMNGLLQVKEVPIVYKRSANLDEPNVDPFIQRFAGQIYYNPWEGIDFRPNPWMQNNKALTRAVWGFDTSSQTVPTILPTYLDPDYVYALPSEAPVVAALPHKASTGGMASYVRITAYGSPSAGYWLAETTDAEVVKPTASRKNEQKKIAETRGGTTGFAQAAGVGFKDILAEAINERLTAFKVDALEDGFLNGDGNTTSPKGLLTWQGTTNQVDASSANVTLAEIRKAIKLAWDAGGDLESYGFGITDSTTYAYIKSLLQEYLGYNNVESYTLPWGLKTFEIDGVPFLKSRKMPQAANAKKILLQDRRFIYADVLQDTITELLAKTGDGQNFNVKFYGTPINKCPEYGSVIANIA